jgi:hypothetical protein
MWVVSYEHGTETAHVMSHCHVSPHLTSLAPQSAHRTRKIKRFPSSAWIDRIFRNERVTGSNPVSSTKHTGQGGFWLRSVLARSTILKSRAPQMAHSTPARSTSLGCEVLSHGTSHELTRSDQECGSLVWHATIQWVRNGPSRATYIAAHTAG